jgi:hypothetical protein
MTKEITQDIRTDHDLIVPQTTITIGQIHQEIDTAEITTIDHIPHLGMTEGTKNLLIKIDQDPNLLIGIHTGTIIIIVDQHPPIISKEAIVHQTAIKGHIHQISSQGQIRQMGIIDLIRGTVTEIDHPLLIGKTIHSQMDNQAQLSLE